MRTQLPCGLIKSTPSSFIVQELVGLEQTPVPLHARGYIKGWNEDDTHTIFHLVKKGITTHDAVREVSRQLEVPLKSVTYYGRKQPCAKSTGR